MAGRRTANERVDQGAQARKAPAPDADLKIKAPRNLELLRIDWQFASNGSVPSGDPADGFQMAQSPEPKKKYDLVSIQPNAGAFPSAATAHCGKEHQANTLPAGTEFLPEATGCSVAEGKPAGACESELT